MTSHFAVWDYLVLGAVLAALVALAARVGRRQATSDEFLLADRSLAWWPTGLSLALAGFAAIFCCGIPNEAYWAGAKFLLFPLLLWAALPIALWCVIPLYGTLRLESVYEYLELRFDATTRAIAGGLYIVGMVLWLGGVLVLPCAALYPRTGLSFTTLFLLVATGGAATLIAFLGGIRGGVWTGAVQSALVAVALAVVLVAVVVHLKPGEGPSRIWEVAGELGRTDMVEPMPDGPPEWSAARQRWSFWTAHWSIWAVVPYLAVISMFFFVADQATLQRFFAARAYRDRAYSFLLGMGLLSVMVVAATFVGMGLLAVYQDSPQEEIPPSWIVNSAVDRKTGEPLIDVETPVDREAFGDLVARGAILDPTLDRPIRQGPESTAFVTPEGDPNVLRLATRRPRSKRGDPLIRRGGDRMFAQFVWRHLSPLALGGLVLAAMAAAAMAAFGSGITALTTLAVVDFHRRHGWGERALARRRGKTPEELDQVDELTLARPLTLVFGAAIVVVSLAVAALDGGLGYLLGVMNVVAGPLLGVFLLGLFTRRTTGLAASIALGCGVLAALGTSFGHFGSEALGPVWPFDGPFWPMLVALGMTLAVGYLLSLLIGRRKSRDELSGLIVGVGRLGHLKEYEGR